MAGDQLREDQMRCLITTTATALWVVRNIPPTSGQLQVVNQLWQLNALLEDENGETVSTTPTIAYNARQERSSYVNDANDDVSAGPQSQAATQ